MKKSIKYSNKKSPQPLPTVGGNIYLQGSDDIENNKILR